MRRKIKSLERSLLLTGIYFNLKLLNFLYSLLVLMYIFYIYRIKLKNFGARKAYSFRNYILQKKRLTMRRMKCDENYKRFERQLV